MIERRHARLLDRQSLLWILGLSAVERAADASTLESPPSRDWRANLAALVLLVDERISYGVSDPYSLFALAEPVFRFAVSRAPAETVIAAFDAPASSLLDQLHAQLELLELGMEESTDVIAHVGALLATLAIRAGGSSRSEIGKQRSA